MRLLWIAVVGLTLGASASCSGRIGGGAETEPPPSNDPSGPAPGGADGGTDPVPVPGDDPDPDPDAAPIGASCGWPSPRALPLSRIQYQRTVAALGPEAAAQAASLASALTDGATGVQLSEPSLEALLQAAEPLADAVASTFCATDESLGCIRNMIEDLGERAFRRTLRDEEVERYTAFYTSEMTEPDADPAAVRSMLVQALLIAPDTLFRTEIGTMIDDRRVLTPSEVAQAVSYVIADGPPDPALRAAAEAGQLRTRDEIRAHAARLLQTPNTAEGLLVFLDSLFHFRGAGELAKDPETYPAWSETLAQDMADETEQFVRHVLWSSTGTFGELMTAPYSFVNERLGSVYGLSVDGNDLQRTDLPAQRRGSMTHGSFLSTYAHDDSSAPIARGHFVREILLCQVVPPPPPSALNDFVERDPTLTARQWLTQQHAAQPACQSCHALMDPLGLPFEQFDGTGAFRTQELGQTIDPSGEITAFGSLTENIPVSGPTALIDALSDLDQVEACMVRRLFEYAHRRDATEDDQCAINALIASFAQSGSLTDLLAAMVADDSFVTRGTTP